MKKMEEIAISKFKATCLAVMERVRKTGEPVRVTRFGKPVADITPVTPEKPPERRLGAMAGTLEFIGDPDQSGLDPGWEERWLAKWDERLAEEPRARKRAGKRPGRSKRRSP